MNKTFIYDGEGRIEEDVPRPIWPCAHMDYQTHVQDLDRYNSRLSYPVHPDHIEIAKKLWKKDQKVTNYELREECDKVRCHCRCHSTPSMVHIRACCNNGWIETNKRTTAIPLPVEAQQSAVPDKSGEEIDPLKIATEIWDKTDPFITACMQKSNFIIGACEMFKYLKNHSPQPPLKDIEQAAKDKRSLTQQMFDEIFEWQRNTFTKATPLSCANHLAEEVDELIKDFEDKVDPYRAKKEIADCFLLLISCADHYGMSYHELCEVVWNKFEINKARKWGEVNDKGYVKHIEETK